MENKLSARKTEFPQKNDDGECKYDYEPFFTTLCNEFWYSNIKDVTLLFNFNTSFKITKNLFVLKLNRSSRNEQALQNKGKKYNLYLKENLSISYK
jgi:hypothetical protein